MSIYTLIDGLIHDTLGVSLPAVRSELVLCATIVLILLVRMFDRRCRVHATYLLLIGAGLALWLAAPSGCPAAPCGVEVARHELFTGMLVYDAFAVYMRSLLLAFLVLFAVLLRISGVPAREDATEFAVLVLSATLGMCLMVSANHMLIVFLGLEMASVPSYVLAGMLRHQRPSSEAALKFAVFGGGTAGVMLYGISLVTGTLGSAHLPTMAVRLGDLLHGPAGASVATVLILGGLMIAVGLAFKLSAVPFHFWTPDVFHGAAAEVGAFLSVASKAAALALVVRLALGLTCVPERAPARAGSATMALAEQATAVAEPGQDVTDAAQAYLEGVGTPQRPSPAGWRYIPALNESLWPAAQFVGGLFFLLAAVTCTFGNLAAYGQTNIKRLLAYSTIAHAGYMMMPLAAALNLTATDRDAAASAIAAIAFYAGIYLFMNLGAFALVAFLRNALGSEEIADYAGLVRRAPGLVVCMAIILFSLVGLPPLAGFAGKFTIFASLVSAELWTLLGIGALNTLLSLFYYLRVVKVMVIDAPREPAATEPLPLASAAGAYCLLVTLPLVVFGVWWGPYNWAAAAAKGLF